MTKKRAKPAAAPHEWTVRLGNRDWPLPLLGVAQNRVVVPLVLKLLPKIADARKAALVDPEDEKQGIYPHRLIAGLADADTHEQMCQACFVALTRANPGLTPAEFAELAISHFELVAAIIPVALACGVMRDDFA